jgi:hypothetical protein
VEACRGPGRALVFKFADGSDVWVMGHLAQYLRVPGEVRAGEPLAVAGISGIEQLGPRYTHVHIESLRGRNPRDVLVQTPGLRQGRTPLPPPGFNGRV